MRDRSIGDDDATVETCPTDDELARWLDRREHAIELHLDACAACRQLVAALSHTGANAVDRFGRYELRDVLGAGGMGIVYRAFDPQLRREVALKRLRTRGRAGHRLRREAQTLARLGHPSIIAVYDVGEVDGELFFAMELLRGETLEQRLARGPLPWRDALALLLPAAEGLAAAHAAGVVHRDFKPANVMLTDDGRVVVMDFGVARSPVSAPRPSVTVEQLDDLTKTGELLGTPLYMAPEQLIGASASERSDQFAFCVVMFEAVHGRRPWPASSLAELLERMSSPPSRTGPRRLDRAIRRGLALDGSRRHASMHALIDALQRAARRRVWPIGVAAAVAVLAAWVAMPRDRPPVLCDALEPRMASVWNEDVREPIASWSHSLPTELDAYIDRWDELRDEACASADVARIACLRRHRSAVAALVEGLDDASAHTLALDAFDRLPPPEQCAGLEAPPEIAAQVEALRDRLTRAQASSDLGHQEAADTSMRAIVDDARELGFEPLLAETLLASVTPAEDVGDSDRARASAEEAFWIAERSGHANVAADAALEMVSLLVPDHDIEPAKLWLGHAKARIDRGGVDPIANIELVALQSGIAAVEGRTEDALELADDAWRRYQTALGPSDRTTIDAGVRVARLQRELARFDDALVTYAQLRRLVHERWGTDHLFAAMIANNVGAVHADAGRLDEAVPEFERALEIREAVLGSDHVQVANSLHNVASALHERGRHAEAVPLLERAIAVWRAQLGPDHIILAGGARNLATALDALGEHERALEARDLALRVANETFARDDPRLALDVCGRASTLAHLHRLEEARAELDRCVPILERGLPPAHPERIAALARAKEVLVQSQ